MGYRVNTPKMLYYDGNDSMHYCLGSMGKDEDSIKRIRNSDKACTHKIDGMIIRDEEDIAFLFIKRAIDAEKAKR